MFVSGNFDWAATRDQTLRFSYNRNAFVNKNQGIGGYDEPERAYTIKNDTNTFRAQEVGPLGRRFFINTPPERRLERFRARVGCRGPDDSRIIDAQTTGGAQKAGGRHSRDVNFASDLDYVRGIHSVRVGTAIDANLYRSDESDNYLGTYTFESLYGIRGGPPAQLHAAHRRSRTSDYFNLQSGGLHSGRHPHQARACR